MDRRAARATVTEAVARVHQLINDRLDAEALAQRSRQQQPGVGHRVGVLVLGRNRHRPGGRGSESVAAPDDLAETAAGRDACSVIQIVEICTNRTSDTVHAEVTVADSA
jgi:hypothetical protein